MWYWILYLLMAIWVFMDALKRRNNFIGWSIGTVILGPIVFPVYFAKRSLKEKEVREGGTAWNVLKNFALLWTLTMIIAVITGMANVSNVANKAASGAEQVGVAIGTGLGLAFMAAIWFFPMIFALILGFFLKKSSIVETVQRENLPTKGL